nr:MAG TPA: hypothetical protein [Caudoviricetes sp.]
MSYSGERPLFRSLITAFLSSSIIILSGLRLK